MPRTRSLPALRLHKGENVKMICPDYGIECVFNLKVMDDNFCLRCFVLPSSDKKSFTVDRFMECLEVAKEHGLITVFGGVVELTDTARKSIERTNSGIIQVAVYAMYRTWLDLGISQRKAKAMLFLSAYFSGTNYHPKDVSQSDWATLVFLVEGMVDLSEEKLSLNPPKTNSHYIKGEL